jgi:hypothetical protein
MNDKESLINIRKQRKKDKACIDDLKYRKIKWGIGLD